MTVPEWISQFFRNLFRVSSINQGKTTKGGSSRSLLLSIAKRWKHTSKNHDRRRDRGFRKKRTRTEREAEVKKRALNSYAGGVACGFDPAAGVRYSEALDDPQEGHYELSEQRSESDRSSIKYEYDSLGRRTGRQWYTGSHWGIERGGPGMSGRLGYGSLISWEEMRQKIEKKRSQNHFEPGNSTPEITSQSPKPVDESRTEESEEPRAMIEPDGVCENLDKELDINTSSL